eukprot:gene3940-7150_t
MNLYLEGVDEKVTDLRKDLTTGETLRTFLILLSGKKLNGKFAKKPSFKIHKIANLQRILEFFVEEKIPTHGIKPEDIENGDLKTINILMTYVVIHFHFLKGKSIGSAKNITLMKNELIYWIKSKTGSEIENFNSSFEDGKILTKLYFSLSSNPVDITEDDLTKNYKLIMNSILEEFKVPIIISPENLTKAAEETSIMMYLIYLKNYDETKEFKLKIDKTMLEENVPVTPRSMTTPRRMEDQKPDWTKRKLKHIGESNQEKKSNQKDFRGVLKRTPSTSDDFVLKSMLSPKTPHFEESKKIEEKNTDNIKNLEEKISETNNTVQQLNSPKQINESKNQLEQHKLDEQKKLQELENKKKIKEQNKIDEKKLNGDKKIQQINHENITGDFKEMKQKIKELEEQLEEKNKQNGRLLAILDTYEPYVPKEKLRNHRLSEKEHCVFVIQNALKRKKNTKTFTTLIDEFYHSKLGSSLKERNKILREFVKTETVYVQTLDTLNKFYYEPFQTLMCHKNKKTKLINDDDFQIIFSNFEELIPLHHEFLKELEERMDDFPIVHFGKTIHSQIPNFQVYKKFVNNFDTAFAKVKQLIKGNKELDDYFKESAKKSPGALGFHSLFIQPVQRLPRYSLLLKELIKHTSDDHVDFEDFKNAKSELDAYLLSINESKKKVEHARSLVRVQGLSHTIPEDVHRVVIKEFIRDGFAFIDFHPKNTSQSLSSLTAPMRHSSKRLSFSTPFGENTDHTIKERRTKYLMVLFKLTLLIFETSKKAKKKSLLRGSPGTTKQEGPGYYDKIYEETFFFHSKIDLIDCELLTLPNQAVEKGGFTIADSKETLNISIEEHIGGNQTELWVNDFFKSIEGAKQNK